LWKLLSGTAYAAALGVWVKHVVPSERWRDDLSIVFLLALPASSTSLQNGHANLLAVAAILAGFAAVARNALGSAGVWAAGATLVKGFPAAIAVMLGLAYGSRL